LKTVRPSDLHRIYENIRAAGRSSSTALKAHNVMSAMFEAARLERLVDINVTDGVRAPKASKVERDTFTPDETRNLLTASEHVRHGSKWITSLYAGLRQGERLGATLDALDTTRGLFTVRWNLVEANYRHGCDNTCTEDTAAGRCPNRILIIPEGVRHQRLEGRLLLVPPKSGQERTFPLPPTLVSILDAHIDALKSQPNPHGLLWPAADGSPVTGREDQAEWKHLLQLANVDRPTATTHWARHTAVSDFTAAGVPDRVIGEVVGHKSPGVTGNYQHVSSQDAADAMKRMVDRRQLEAR
jgi:site-specific recombinase XerD